MSDLHKYAVKVGLNLLANLLLLVAGAAVLYAARQLLYQDYGDALVMRVIDILLTLGLCALIVRISRSEGLRERDARGSSAAEKA